MNRFLRSLRLVLGFGLLGLGRAGAHEAGLSVAQVQARGSSLELTVTYALADVQRMLPPSVRLGTDTSRDTIEAARSALDELASLLWEVSTGGKPLAPRDHWVDFTPSDNLAFHLVYPRPESGIIRFHARNLGSLGSGHHEDFSWRDEAGRVRVEQMLTAGADTVEISLAVVGTEPVAAPAGAPAETAPATFGGFLHLGLEHIAFGWDHLLFLFGLLLVCRSFKSMAAIITCFTVAHSLTLALATLDVVNLPARWVEPLIAVSIVFVGVENLVRRGTEPRGRWALTLAFGLVHGFGFSSALRDLGIGTHGGGVALPLLAFNLGVELGQLAVAALVLPLVWQLQKRESFLRRGIPALSSLVVAAGLYWLVQRTLLA